MERGGVVVHHLLFKTTQQLLVQRRGWINTNQLVSDDAAALVFNLLAVLPKILKTEKEATGLFGQKSEVGVELSRRAEAQHFSNNLG